jgi:hypothetical protein
VQQTLRIGRLKTLERLGLAQERQQGVWQLDGRLESKLRRLGDRADKFRTMQQVLKELGIDRGTAALALFERGPRKVPLIGKVIGVGMVDEITDRTWVVIDAVDGRVHYADLGRIEPDDAPHRGMLVALAGDSTLRGKPTSVPRIEVLSELEVGRLASYDGPTWLDEAIVGKLQVQKELPGFPAELRQAIADRGRWLAERGLADVSGLNEVAPKPDMMRGLRQRETARLAETLSRQLNAIHVPHEPGSRISGVYERAITTPTGKLAVIRSADTFTLAPWKPALEPLRGRAVLGLVGPARVMWTLGRGRALPGRGCAQEPFTGPPDVRKRARTTNAIERRFREVRRRTRPRAVPGPHQHGSNPHAVFTRENKSTRRQLPLPADTNHLTLPVGRGAALRAVRSSRHGRIACRILEEAVPKR